MARKSDPAVTVQDHENLIQGVAKHFLQQVYGPDGMPWGTKFSELEELAIQQDETRTSEALASLQDLVQRIAPLTEAPAGPGLCV